MAKRRNRTLTKEEVDKLLRMAINAFERTFEQAYREASDEESNSNCKRPQKKLNHKKKTKRK